MSERTMDAVPRPALLGAAILVGGSLLLAAAARLTGLDTRQMPPPVPVRERSLQFQDEAGGRVRVLDAASGSVLAELAPGSDGFVRATLRSLIRERRTRGVADPTRTPFRLIASADGRLALEDPATGRHFELEAFGATNAARFARFLPALGAAAPGGSLQGEQQP